jgi:hypothetical protein
LFSFQRTASRFRESAFIYYHWPEALSRSFFELLAALCEPVVSSSATCIMIHDLFHFVNSFFEKVYGFSQKVFIALPLAYLSKNILCYWLFLYKIYMVLLFIESRRQGNSRALLFCPAAFFIP